MNALLTPSRLALLWGCSVSWIYGQIDSGKLKAHWLGGWRIDPADADAFKEGQTALHTKGRLHTND